jgi:hypothetical protein
MEGSHSINDFGLLGCFEETLLMEDEAILRCLFAAVSRQEMETLQKAALEVLVARGLIFDFLRKRLTEDIASCGK